MNNIAAEVVNIEDLLVNTELKVVHREDQYEVWVDADKLRLSRTAQSISNQKPTLLSLEKIVDCGGNPVVLGDLLKEGDLVHASLLDVCGFKFALVKRNPRRRKIRS